MRFLFLFLLISTRLFSQDTNEVYVLTFDGVVNPVAADMVHEAIQEADRANSQCLIIEMDTPGGLMKSMKVIVKDILSSPIPIVVYIAPPGSRAGSAGVFITYAANVAAMAPGTNIGAAHPVNFGFGADTSETMMEKITNDAVAYITSIAEKRHRNVQWAEKAVRESASIPANEALKLNVINVISPNLDSLLTWLNGKEYEMLNGKKILHTENARIVQVEISWRYKLLDVISDPNIAYILLLIGMIGIFFELSNPGSILPGVVGGISLILAFYALHTLPVNYAGVLLILLALILFIAEVKIPSYGLLTVGGVLSLVLGSIMLFKGSMPFFQLSWKVIAFATIVTTLFFIFVVGLGIRAQLRRPVTGNEGLIGEIGKAVEDFIKGSGRVSVHGEIWEATSTDKIKEGDEITVLSVKNLKVTVKKNN
ncbi:MAG: nodulation protein NfeD [Calditrichota bacterium]|jgi:membrane-bound serine protease (ClpP class)